MFGFLFGKKNKKIENITIEDETEFVSTNMDFDQQISWLEKKGWCTNYNYIKKNILIMDDREEIISSIIDDLKSLNASNDFFIDDYNIIQVSTKMAGFNVLDILEYAPDIEIHFALLDIILGGKRIIDDKRKMVDGVDVAIEIWEHFPAADILFFSGCIIETNDDPISFKNKFNSYTGYDMNNFIIPKDSSFDQELSKLLNFFNGISRF